MDRLASSAPSCCLSPRTTCTTVLLSLYMQDVLGFTVLRAGLGYLGEGAAAPLGGMYVAKLLGRFGGVKMLSAGLLIQGAGTVAMFALPVHVNLAALLSGP
ncbi:MULTISPECIES: MFS transporter [unclassified Streptomyces]|uniref:MFS transporter n=1 Tax=unclassified Streptomyces TaxID=2593676 RepID=UPI0013DAB819|nr:MULTISPECIES: MFS transporter [unclassified Streptomyces]NMI63118.1 MFS transporter [Streptomyces sp. RLA2-12]